MGFLDKITGGIKETAINAAAKVVDSLGKGLDRVFTNDEERMKAQAVLDQVKVDLEKEFNRHLEAIAADATKQFELEIQDRTNARSRETEFIKATGHMDWMQTIVGVLILVAFLGSLILIATRKIPEGSEHLMINALGIIEGLAGMVVGYYYGSSAGSRFKDMKK
jgi:hypothetical protein